MRECLLTNYPRKIPPADLVQVDLDFILVYIKNLDVTTQLLSILVSMDFKWKDPLLMWNESDPLAPRLLFMDQENIWTPNILATNNDEDMNLEPGRDGIRVYPNGMVNMMIFKQLQIQCHVDVKRYPFDEQFCKVSLTPWGFNYSLPNISHHRKDRELGKSVEWQLVQTSTGLTPVQGISVNSVAVITFHLRREYIFYLLTVIFPVFLLSAMNACAFLLPVESGEKMSYLISILVTYSVFINYTNAVMPKSGTPSRLGIYLVLVLCESCAAILVTLGVLSVHHSTGNQCSRKQNVINESGNVNSVDETEISYAVKLAKIIKPKEKHCFIIFMVFSLLSPTLFFM